VDEINQLKPEGLSIRLFRSPGRMFSIAAKTLRVSFT
jgi:hypothetical protein